MWVRLLLSRVHGLSKWTQASPPATFLTRVHRKTLMYFSPGTLDTAGSYHLSSDLQNLLSKQESDLTRDRPDLSLGRLPWWLSSKESACQCRRHKFESWSGGFHIPWSS